MTRIFAQYEHVTLGFPKVKLKWTEERDKFVEPYLVINGVIEGPWRWHNIHPEPFIKGECERFDAYVRKRFAENIEVQG